MIRFITQKQLTYSKLLLYKKLWIIGDKYLHKKSTRAQTLILNQIIKLYIATLSRQRARLSEHGHTAQNQLIVPRM